MQDQMSDSVAQIVVELYIRENVAHLVVDDHLNDTIAQVFVELYISNNHIINL